MITTAGIFFINKDNKLLVAHPTNHSAKFWSIPKGKIDGNETTIEAAVRETWEETNVILDLNTLKYYELDIIKYKSKKKKLKPFVVLEIENNIDSDKFNLKCNSTIPKENKWNGGLQEMDGWKFISISEASKCLHETQIACLNEVVNIINK